jgi:hypothetical protein
VDELSPEFQFVSKKAQVSSINTMLHSIILH